MPLDEFVAQRDVLAKSLRAGKQRDEAAAVKALRKPTAGAWALNQAVRRRRAETDRLLAAGERLRAAHAALLSGGGRDELRAALDEQRALAGTLADCAENIASETGKSGPALKERVRATLHATALDDEIREALARGRLVREQEAVGLGTGFGTAEAPLPPAPSLGKRRPRPEKQLQSDEERARRELEQAGAAHDEARAELEEAERAHESAAARVEAARAELVDSEEAERQARRGLRDSRRLLTKRERELGRLTDR